MTLASVIQTYAATFQSPASRREILLAPAHLHKQWKETFEISHSHTEALSLLMWSYREVGEDYREQEDGMFKMALNID